MGELSSQRFFAIQLQNQYWPQVRIQFRWEDQRSHRYLANHMRLQDHSKYSSRLDPFIQRLNDRLRDLMSTRELMPRSMVMIFSQNFKKFFCST